MTEADVRDALREVVDPEIGVNIVDLGLVYGVQLDGHDVRVTMTMTSAACPLGEYLQDLARSAIRLHLPDARRVVVDLVSDPPWTADMMSDAARRQLQ